MSSKDCCYFVRGELYALNTQQSRSWSYAWNYSWGIAQKQMPVGRFLGNVDLLQINVDKTINRVVRNSNYINTPECADITINAITLSMNLRCASPENLIMGYYGNKKVTAAPMQAVIDQPVLTQGVYAKDTMIPFNQIGVDLTSVVIKRSDTLVNLILNQDYVITPFGIKLKKEFNFVLGINLLVSYSYNKAVQSIEALTQSPKKIGLFFAGYKLGSEEPIVIKIYNAILSPISNFEVISRDDFASFSIEGEILANESITANDESKYFKIEQIA